MVIKEKTKSKLKKIIDQQPVPYTDKDRPDKMGDRETEIEREKKYRKQEIWTDWARMSE